MKPCKIYARRRFHAGLVLVLVLVLALLLQLGHAPVCAVTVYRLQYETVGVLGEATTASGALMIPSGSAAACQGLVPS